MKQSAPLQPFLVLLLITSCAFTIGCGGAASDAAQPRAYVQATIHPLVAQFNVASPCSGQAMVEFGPDTSYGRSTAWYPVSPMFSAAHTFQQTNILVAGMRASTTYHMSSQVQCAGGATFNTPDLTFTTGALPSLTLPVQTVTRPSPSPSSPENPGIELVDVIASGTPALFTDRDANPIWYYDVGAGNFPFTFKLLPNGHMILSVTRTNLPAILIEVDLAGNTIREMDVNALGVKMQAAGFDFVPTDYHHDVLPLPNGHVVVITNFTKNFTDLPGYPGTTAVLGDGIIDLDQNWNPVWAWNAFDYLDVNRHLNGLPDWTHSNALIYSPADGDLILSMRHQSWVLKIDYNNGAGSGNLLWRLGYQGDFALTQDGAPTDDPSLWFSFQHFPSMVSQSLPQTTLAIWDNGDNRVIDSNGDVCAITACYSRGTIFQIDDSAMVANLLWADTLQYFSQWGGSINQLENGNVEFDLNAALVPPGPGVASEVQEVTQTSNPQIVWKMDITPGSNNAYRAYRVPSLYPGVTWQY
jgi:arylsulfate sulfotransferase